MIQRIALITVFILLFVIIVFSIFFLDKKKSDKRIDPKLPVPINTELFFQVKDIKKLITQYNNGKHIWEGFRKLEGLININNQLAVLDSLIRNDKDAKKLIANLHEIVIAVSVKSKDKMDLLFILPLQNSDRSKLERIIQRQCKNRYSINKRTYNHTSLFSIQEKKKKNEKINYCFTGSFFLISTSSLLVEDAILQLSSPSEILNDKHFIQLSKTEGKGGVTNCYVNHKRFPRLLSLYVNENLKSFIAKFSDYATWSELDIQIKESKVMLNGFTILENDKRYFTDVFARQKPVSFNMEQIIPSTCILYASVLVSNPQFYRQDYKTYLEKNGEIHTYNKNLYNWKKNTGIHVEDFFYRLFEGEMAAVFLENVRFDKVNNSFFVMKVKSRSKAKKNLTQMIVEYSAKKGKQASTYIINQPIDEETSYTIYQLPFKNAAYHLFGRIFKDIPTNSVMLIGNYLIAGNSPKSLKKFIHENLLRKTLLYDDFYTSQKKYFSGNNVNFCLYANIGNGFSWLKDYFNKETQQILDADEKNLKGFKCLGYQFSVEQQYLYNNIFISYDPEIKEKPQTIWQSRLDADIAMKPVLVSNHITKEKEILVQDIDNKVYLINNTGRIIWKNRMNESVNSWIYQVDYFKNGKLQYLFSTESQLHLIDRNGNYVGRYPVNLKASASAGMALFDYEGDKNFRIFIPCQDKNVYAYDLKGNIINGWKFDGADFVIKNPIQHFRVDNKDYIVFADRSRCYILNRRGKERIKPESLYGKSDYNKFTFDPKKKRILTTDSVGRIVYYYFDGKVKTQKVDEFSNKHFFESADVNNDGVTDFIFVDANEMKVYASGGKNIFKVSFNKHIDFPPKVYEFSTRNYKIGITDGKKIYLYDSRGKLHPGFPLQGKTNFTIGFLRNKSSRFNLFVGGDNELLYNYTVR